MLWPAESISATEKLLLFDYFITHLMRQFLGLLALAKTCLLDFMTYHMKIDTHWFYLISIQSGRFTASSAAGPNKNKHKNNIDTFRKSN